MVESLVFLEMSYDMATLSKKTALMLFCYFRQAERSVHYALSFPDQWPQFLAYYDDGKKTRIADVIEMLKVYGATQGKDPGRQALAQDGWLNTVRCAAALVCNPLKRRWTFSAGQLSFFLVTLDNLLSILHQEHPPQKAELIELRRNCFECNYIVGRKLIGDAEIRKAASI